MYLKDSLSASQISDNLGISKTAVLARLHYLGVRNATSIGERMENPKNYRSSIVPYGYRKCGNQLVVTKKESRICRLVAKLMNDQGFSLMGAARELMTQKIKNRNGNIWWDHSMGLSKPDPKALLNPNQLLIAEQSFRYRFLMVALAVTLWV